MTTITSHPPMATATHCGVPGSVSTASHMYGASRSRRYCPSGLGGILLRRKMITPSSTAAPIASRPTERFRRLSRPGSLCLPSGDQSQMTTLFRRRRAIAAATAPGVSGELRSARGGLWLGSELDAPGNRHRKSCSPQGAPFQHSVGRVTPSYLQPHRSSPAARREWGRVLQSTIRLLREFGATGSLMASRRSSRVPRAWRKGGAHAVHVEGRPDSAGEGGPGRGGRSRSARGASLELRRDPKLKTGAPWCLLCYLDHRILSKAD